MGDLKDRFDKYDARNPHIWEAFQKKAKQIRKTGRKRYGAWTIIQVMRWEADVKTAGDDFKISNDFVALYARKLAKQDPFYIKFFGLRPMKRT